MGEKRDLSVNLVYTRPCQRLLFSGLSAALEVGVLCQFFFFFLYVRVALGVH